MRLGNQTAHRSVTEDEFYDFSYYNPQALAPEWCQFFCRTFFGKDFEDYVSSQSDHYDNDDYDDDDDENYEGANFNENYTNQNYLL